MNPPDIECPNPDCGGCAFEVPDNDGDTWCVECGTCVNVSDLDNGDDESWSFDDEIPERRGSRHRPEVAGPKDRPVPVQISERVAHSGSSARATFLTDDSEDWS